MSSFLDKSPSSSFENTVIELPNQTGRLEGWKSRIHRIFGRGRSQVSTSEVEEKIMREVARLSELLPEEMLEAAQSRKEGLFEEEVLRQRLLWGDEASLVNPFWDGTKLMGRCFANPFNFLLGILAIISIATGDISTFSVMLTMIVVSTILRFYQELKSMRKAAALASSVSNKVRLSRQVGSLVQASSKLSVVQVEVEDSQVVPGDIVLLSSGDLIPADSIIISSHALTVSQSMVTGEVFPTEKGVKTRFNDLEKEEEVIHRRNVLLGGTSITSGECHALVVNTGSRSYAASIATHSKKARPINAFEKSIRRISYLLLGFMGVMTPLVFIIQGVTNKAGGWMGAFLFSIAVAVGLTPEMLPLVVNANLARGAMALAKKNVIVKRLDGVQSLGGVTCLCTDKTGTLTCDEVRFHSSVDASNNPSAYAFQLALINSTIQTGSRSLLDRAVIEAAPAKLIDVSALLKLGEVPFDSFRRLLTVYTSEPGMKQGVLVSKGAVDEVLACCTSLVSGFSDEEHDLSPASLIRTTLPTSPLDAQALARIQRTADLLNEEGFRLIAVAYRIVEGYRSYSFDIEPEDERDLTFVGFVAFLDPPKEDAGDAIKSLTDLKVAVKILTGDAPTIAVKVARQIGLLPMSNLPSSMNSDVLTGKALAVLATGERSVLLAAVNRAVVFAKLSPYQKLEVVEALRESGHSVAFLGDGVNDCLALRGSDVGISVESGSAIAKDAADIILLEKSLAVIVEGVILGRTTLLNTVKYIKIAASSNFGNVFSILAASAWLPYQPMLPLQILIQNLLYDFSQSVIPWDNVDADYLTVPVKWDVRSVARFMIIFGPVSSIFDIVTFSINWFYYGITTADDSLVEMAQTNWFLVGTTTQLLVVYFLRTGKVPFIQSSPSKPFLSATLFFLGVGYTLPYIPKLKDAFHFIAPHPDFYGMIAGIAVAYCFLVQGVKLIYKRVWHSWL